MVDYQLPMNVTAVVVQAVGCSCYAVMCTAQAERCGWPAAADCTERSGCFAVMHTVQVG